MQRQDERPKRTRRVRLAVGLAIGLLLTGCAASSHDLSVQHLQSTAAERIEQRAVNETADPALAAQTREVPPGISAHDLEPVLLPNERAMLPVNDALQAMAGAIEHPTAQSRVEPPELSAEQQARAVGQYIRGCEFFLKGNIQLALEEFDQARAIDQHSPEIARQLARCFASIRGSQHRAADLFAHVRQVQPDDDEASMMLASFYVTIRDFRRAAAILAHFQQTYGPFDHDNGARYLAQYWLFRSAWELGFLNAAIELGNDVATASYDDVGLTRFATQLEFINRQRSDIWRQIGDARCRLGRYDVAAEAYRVAGTLPTADPNGLAARQVFALLRSGRAAAAQRVVFDHLQAAAKSHTEPDLALCSYISRHVRPSCDLREGVLELYAQFPDDETLLRATVALVGGTESVRLLLDYVGRRPRDLDAVATLLEWATSEDVALALSTTQGLIELQPDLTSSYVQRLVASAAEPMQLLVRVRLQDQTPMRAILESQILIEVAGPGVAWNVIDEACAQWPDVEGLHLTRLTVAVELNDSQLIRKALNGCLDIDTAAAWRLRSIAHRVQGDIDAMVVAAQESANRAPGSPDIMIDLAEAYLRQSLASRSTQQRHVLAQTAVDIAGEVLDRDATRERAYPVLLRAHQPGVAGAQSGVLADADAYNRARAGLIRNCSKSTIAVDLALREREVERAAAIAQSVYEADPSNVRALQQLAITWHERGAFDIGLAWLDERLAEKPGNPALLNEWMRIKILTGKGDEAVRRFDSMLATDPSHLVARRLLEAVLLQIGNVERAAAMQIDRLSDRPDTYRKQLLLADIDVRLERNEDALDRVSHLHTSAAELTRIELFDALSVLGRIAGSDDRRYRIVDGCVKNLSKRFDDLPLAVYVAGFNALAFLKADDSEMRELMTHAIDYSGTQPDAIQDQPRFWIDIAQELLMEGFAGSADTLLTLRLQMEPVLQDEHYAVLWTAAITAMVTSDASIDEIIARMQQILVDSRLHNDELLADQDIDLVVELLLDYSTLCAYQENHDKSDALIMAALKRKPDHAMAMNDLGYARLERGLIDQQTIAWIHRAWELKPNYDSILDTVGWLRYKQGKFEDEENGRRGALSLIQASLTNAAEPSAEVLDHLGDTYWRMGDTNAAVKAWRQAAATLQHFQRQQYVPAFLANLRNRHVLVVVDPEVVYDRLFGSLKLRVAAKLAASAAGNQPNIAPTAAELNGQPQDQQEMSLNGRSQ